MATEKNRVVAYLSGDEYATLKLLSQNLGVSDSKAIAMAIKSMSTLSGKVSIPVVKQDPTAISEHKIDTLIDGRVKDLKKSILADLAPIIQSEVKQAIAVQSDELYQMLAEQAKQAQLATLKQNQADTVTEKIQEREDSLAPETADTIAVEKAIAGLGGEIISPVNHVTVTPLKEVGDTVTPTKTPGETDTEKQSKLAEINAKIQRGKTLTGEDLAVRFGAGKSTVSTNASQGLENFKKWSNKKDPDGLTWEFSGEKHTRVYFPAKP